MSDLSPQTLTGDKGDGCDGLNQVYSIFAGATWLMLIVSLKVPLTKIDFLKNLTKSRRSRHAHH
ncbi:MAG: hypothetical protein AB4063_17105 [Crocosphaera sp.]